MGCEKTMSKTYMSTIKMDDYNVDRGRYFFQLRGIEVRGRSVDLGACRGVHGTITPSCRNRTFAISRGVRYVAVSHFAKVSRIG